MQTIFPPTDSPLVIFLSINNYFRVVFGGFSICENIVRKINKLMGNKLISNYQKSSRYRNSMTSSRRYIYNIKPRYLIYSFILDKIQKSTFLLLSKCIIII